jgi:uridine kinase
MSTSSPSTETMMRELRDEVRQHLRSGRVIVAIDGLPGAGQAEFADALAGAFAEEGVTALRASISGFRKPGSAAETDVDELRRVLVEPFRSKAPQGFALAPGAALTTAPVDAVLVVDGDFLLRAGLRGLWNWSAWLEVHPSAASERLTRETGAEPEPGADANGAAYRREGQAAASALVDNTDASNPVRIFGDFC